MIEKLIVGGAHSGKKERLAALGFAAEDIADGGVCSLDKAFDRPVLYGLHLLVRRLMQKGIDPRDFVLGGLSQNKVQVVISDEIGCGVIPMDRFERDWREQVGRILCEIAREVPSVERVFCGVAMEIKAK
ncbi:MAG: bifunctional adenosylcobinamide kinase/adenosylcobinamide-phosphate guanylyltransferase [Oscillospiraceae bacterium]|nr:bifunctional adenosylcobinamide kinase/adenosylcobinamide-phosphate guanylyltransferase [Oscillospiraceae bacterium]